MMYNRLTTIVIAGALGLGTAVAAHASHRHDSQVSQRYDNRLAGNARYASLSNDSFCTERPWSCEATPVQREISRQAHRTRIGHAPGRTRTSSHRGGLSVSSLVSALQSKVSEIISACGARLVSSYRPGAHVAGTSHASLHSTYPARAADLSGNPSCIYSHLHGWQGGYSTDYGRVRHVHISYSPPGSGYLAGREWHARFAHFGGGYHRYTRRHHHRYAMR
jgi:hypothetical protein